MEETLVDTLVDCALIVNATKTNDKVKINDFIKLLVIFLEDINFLIDFKKHRILSQLMSDDPRIKSSMTSSITCGIEIDLGEILDDKIFPSHILWRMGF